MVLLTYCIPCRGGNHDRCQKVMQAVPEGMMGGVRCRCDGECRDRLNPAAQDRSLDRYPEVHRERRDA